MFPSLSILDTLDKIGKDAFNNKSMLEAASRVPDTLFDKSPPPPPMPIHKPIEVREKKKLKAALARTGSLDSMNSKKGPSAPLPLSGIFSKDAKRVPGKAGKTGKAKTRAPIGAGKTRSSRAGLLFPVGRIKRKLKEIMIGQRVGVGSSIYLAATLEYLTAELLEIAGNDAKHEGKKRITPQAIKRSLKGDEEMNRMLQNVTIGMLG
jgi:histone H2A